MRYVAAYLLAALGGNENPSEADLKKILSSVGIDAEGENIKRVIGQLKGKNLEELIEAGKQKLASVPSGGAAVAASAGGAGAGEAPKEEKKEEAKKEEESDDGSDDDMGFGLFD